MKTRLLSAIALSVVLLASCSQGKDDQAEKIKALEEKIAAMEGTNIPVPADMAQTATAADPSTLGSFQFSEM
jgi:PBP1b-binding outer membrane lipoprotein LpoB